jgi:hypothetical protein
MFALSLVIAPMAAHAVRSVAAVSSVGAVSAVSCTGLQAVDPLCYAASAAGSIGGSVAVAGIDAVFNGLSQWVASGAEWLLSQIGNVLVSTTSINLGADWFVEHYKVMTALAGVVVLPLLLVSTLQAVYRQNAGQLVRSFFVQLPLALLLGVVAVQIVILCLSATDALCTEVAGGSGSDVHALLAGMSKGLVIAVADPGMATFVLLLVGLLVAAASFVLWLELLVRAAAVYVAVLFLPLAMATLVWPTVAHLCRRLVETLTALILSKFVIVATLSLAASAVGSGTAGTGDAGAGFASVLAGAALLVLATFVPFSILRLIPMVEAGAVGHLDGVRQRATAGLTHLPMKAGMYALKRGQQASGAAKLMAQAGTPGTGGQQPTGGSGVGGTNDGGADDATVAEDEAAPFGGRVPMHKGIPGSEEPVMARLNGPPRPKGPKPLLPSPAETRAARQAAAAGGGSGGPEAAGGASAGVASAGGDSAGGDSGDGGSVTDGLPPGTKLMGNPGPYDRRWAIGYDAIGPKVWGLSPLRERPRADDAGPS